MNKIYEIQDIDLELEDVKEKVNELVRAVNNLKCVEEVLSPGDCLVACNMCGKMELRRVKYPKEKEEK